jgi:hypothetical protein
MTSSRRIEEINDLNSVNRHQPRDSDTILYQRCLHESLQAIQVLVPINSESEDSLFTCESLFTLEKRAGAKETENPATTRYRSRAGSRFYFKIFPWFIYLLEKKKNLSGNYFFRETIEASSMRKIIEAMNYFFSTGLPYQEYEIKFLSEIFKELNWEKDQEKTVFTRIIQVYQAFKAYRAVLSGEFASIPFLVILILNCGRIQRDSESSQSEKITE